MTGGIPSHVHIQRHSNGLWNHRAVRWNGTTWQRGLEQAQAFTGFVARREAEN